MTVVVMKHDFYHVSSFACEVTGRTTKRHASSIRNKMFQFSPGSLDYMWVQKDGRAPDCLARQPSRIGVALSAVLLVPSHIPAQLRGAAPTAHAGSCLGTVVFLKENN